MKNNTALDAERQQLTASAQSILQCFKEGKIDLDDVIEELRPIRMRMHDIRCQLENNSEAIERYEEA